MTFAVTKNYIRCEYTDCAEVRPVSCFHEGPNFLVIDPDECINGVCAFPNARWMPSISRTSCPQPGAIPGAKCAAVPGMAGDRRKKDPLPDAEQWAEVMDKIQYLER